MKRKFCRELWGTRFNKMLELEKKSVLAYETLMGECVRVHKFDAIQPHFEKLIADEKRHVTLVTELIEILNRQTN